MSFYLTQAQQVVPLGEHLGRDIYNSLFPFFLLPGSGQDNEIKLLVESAEDCG